MASWVLSCLAGLISCTLISAAELFDVQRRQVLKPGRLGIVDTSIVTGIVQCEIFCLNSPRGCDGANLLPVRAGMYSCELIKGFSPSDSLDMQPSKDGVLLRRKDICQVGTLCYHEGICSPNYSFPYYSCRCITPCYGQRCESCFPIPGLFAPITRLVLDGNIELSVPKEDGWIILLRRKDGSLQFEGKLWEDYKRGFGSLENEFWLGNEWVHQLTTNKSYILRFDLVSRDKRWAFAEYSTFWIDSEADNYRLHANGYSGNATDGLNPGRSNYDEDNMEFTTVDKDNDRLPRRICGAGGWWYNHCGYVRLTLRYGLIKWNGFDEQCIFADMKMRPHNASP